MGEKKKAEIPGRENKASKKQAILLV